MEKGYLLPGQTEVLYPAKEILARVQTGRTVYLTGLDQNLNNFAVSDKFGFDVKNVNSYQNSFELLIKDLTRWKNNGYRVVLLSASRTRASRLASDLREYDLKAYCPDSEVAEENTETYPQKQKFAQVEIMVVYGNLHRGFEYPLLKFVVITEGDMFGAEKKKTEA